MLTAPFPLIIFYSSSLFITFEAKLLTNRGKLSVAEGIATFVSAFLPKLADQKLKDPPELIFSRYMSFTKF